MIHYVLLSYYTILQYLNITEKTKKRVDKKSLIAIKSSLEE
ncbi:MAG: hypothetical protein PHY08_04055 [Candidatus Cloacimonetes bacterium]|nr:hypothetical protein [Candidatus Cloacimonadota bacterium]